MTNRIPAPTSATTVAGAQPWLSARRWFSAALMASLLMLLASGLDAQTGQSALTLDRARALARRVSHELAAARAAVEVAVGRETQASAFPNPVLSYSREQASRGGVTSAQDIALIEQRLEIGGQAGRRVAAARLRRQAAQADLAAAEASLDLEVARVFAAVLAGDRRARVASAAAEHFERAKRVMGERLAAGDVSGYAARRVRLEAARYVALAAQAELEARSQRLRLATLLGASADTSPERVDHVAALAAIRDITPDSIEALVVRNHGELFALRLAADAGRADAQLARRERFPTPIAAAGYKNERAPGGTGSLGGFVASLSFALPIFDRRSGSIESADAQANRLIAEAEAARVRVIREARTALEAARQTQARIAVLQAELGEEAEAALGAAETAFAEGEITLIEWLDAVRAYHEAESAYASVIAESIIQCATLERLLGLALIR